MIRPALQALASLALLLAVGCRSGGGWVSSRGASVEQLHLLGTPVALNLDQDPRPDGVGVRVYASTSTTAQAVPINSGTLEIAVFDGALSPGEAATATPLASFSYTAAQLKKFVHQTAVGVSYNFLPRWGEKRPTKTRVTVLAIYHGPGDKRVLSTPVSVPLGKP